MSNVFGLVYYTCISLMPYHQSSCFHAGYPCISENISKSRVTSNSSKHRSALHSSIDRLTTANKLLIHMYLNGRDVSIGPSPTSLARPYMSYFIIYFCVYLEINIANSL